MRRYDPGSPLLIGKIGKDDMIKEKKMESLVQNRLSLFELRRGRQTKSR